MKKTIFTFLSFIISLSTISAQKGIDYNRKYAAGGKLLMSVDSAAKNVYYANVFPNQPQTSFNYLPEVNNLSIQINFRKNINVPSFRYTILEDDKPIVVNQSIDRTKLEDTNAGGDEELFSSTSLGIFSIKGKVITVLVYSVEKPQDIEKSVFYGKPIPKAKIKAFTKRFKSGEGVDYSWITDPEEKMDLILNKNDDELTIYKDRSDIDYLYEIVINEKQTQKTIFKSTVWDYGGVFDETRKPFPYIAIDKSIFKKSGDYEIIILPSLKWKGCLNCDISQSEIEKYTNRHTLSITLEEENYTQREFLLFGVAISIILGLLLIVITFVIKKRNNRRLLQQVQQKNISKLQLSSVRSQLNPHFLFNALSGIQNLMNKNEIDNANKYLSKFARLTRNVLDDKELISLAQEKALLDDYLQMEQLRFGFNYEINAVENLDLDNIEIPSMLLQPFVENAVKHGTSQKAVDGQIIISFNKQANDLVLTVSDNGNGFDTNIKYNGLGLQLSDGRIALLNSIYKENRFILEKQSSSKGTYISLTLTDWL